MTKNILEMIKKGIKWTITPAANDKTGAKLGFVPFELFSKLTASAFQAEIQRELPTVFGKTGMVATRPQNIARAALHCAELLKLFRESKASAKVISVISDRELMEAVKTTNEKQAECAKLAVDIHLYEKQAEMAALFGVPAETINNEAYLLGELRNELEAKRVELSDARKAEEKLCRAKTLELFPSFYGEDATDDNNENKKSN